MNLKYHGCMWKQTRVSQYCGICGRDLNEISTRYCSKRVSVLEAWARSSRLPALDARVKGGQAPALRTLESQQVSALGGATVTSVCGTSAWLTSWSRRYRPNYGALLPSDADMLINGPILAETNREAKSVLWELLRLEMEEFDALGTAMVLSVFSGLGFLQ